MLDYKLLNMTEEIEMAKIRKLLSLLLCLVMVLSFFPAAYAEGENEGTITEEHDCGHDHEHEEETQGTIAPVKEEPEEETSEDPVGDGVLDVPEEAEADEEHEGLVRVEFICDPEDTIITVYDPSQLDENGDPLVIEPEEDGTWLLAPGEYLYDAECEDEALESIKRKMFSVSKLEEENYKSIENVKLLRVEGLIPQKIKQVETNTSHEYGSGILNINWSHIRSVGHQSVSGPCACYALAYCRTILDGYPHSWTEYNASSSSNPSEASAGWYLGSYESTFPTQKSVAFERMYSEVINGNPVVVKVNGSPQHYVAVVGIENVTSTSILTAESFIIIDPAGSTYEAINMRSAGYDLLMQSGVYQVVCDTSPCSAAFSITSSKPVTFLDSAVGGDGTISVRGWAFDRDDLSAAVPIHIYVGGPAGSGASGYAIEANVFRDDVDIVHGCGAYHGFESTISVAERGTQTLYFYACDVGSNLGNDQFATATVTITDPIEITYRITYDANGGTGAPEGQTKTHDVSLTLSDEKPTRSGYTFLGWGTSADATIAQYQPGDSYTANSDLTLYAVWAKNYTVSFDANGGSGAPANQTKIQGKALTLSAVCPTRPCHVFLGWATSSTAATAQYQPGGQFTTDADTVLYAVWTEGTQSEWSTTKPSGVDDSLIETKTQYRYRDKETTTSDQSTLSGWTLYDTTISWSDWGNWGDWSDTAISENDSTKVETRTVYPYYYFYCTNCGRGARYPYWGSNQTCEICGKSGTITSDTGTVEWFTNPWSDSVAWGSNTGKYYQYIDGGIWWNWSDGGGPKTQYRSCTRTQVYTYYFYRWKDWSDWGDTVYTASDSRQVETRTLYRYVQSGDVHQWDSGKVTTAATCTTKGVMTYTCTKCGKTRTAEIAATGHSWGAPSYTWSSDYKTVTAKRTCQNNSSHVETETANTSSQVPTAATCTTKGKTTYTATFSNSAFAKQTKTVENIAALGHSWGEWKVTTPATVDKDGVQTRTCSSCSATETRSYSAETVTITFNANGGSVSPASVKILKNGSISSLPTPSFTGRNFNGWFTAASGGTQVTTATTFAADTTIYAHWTMITYNISYNANGGTGAPAAQTKTYDAALKLSDTKPTRPSVSAGSYTVTLDANGGSVSTNKLTAARTTSYTFKNWNTAANGSGTAYNPGASYTANADVTLYAQWNSSTTTAAVTLPTPTREGFIFKGWAESSTAAAGLTGDYTPTGNVTLYAAWERYFIGDIALLDVTGHPGSEILVPVRLSSNPGLYTINFHVNFDSTVLQLTGVEDGSLTGWSFSSKSSYVHWETSDDADKTASGVIVKLRFLVKEDAADGGTTLSIDDLEAVNRDEEEILYSMVSGQVTISSRIAGDVNGDGQVNLLDLVRLRKYLMHDTSDINSGNADVTGDGKVGSADLVRMRKYLAGDPTAVLD